MSRHTFSVAVCSTIAMVLITLLAGAILMSSNISADDTIVSNVAVSVPVSCNVTSNLDEAHSATINAGQYVNDIGTTTFQVFCNDNTGYAIYAVGYSNEEIGNNKLLATVGGQLSPTHDINTGTATSGPTSAWAMKLNPVAGTYAPTIASDTNGSFANYHIVPTEYTKVATLTSSTDFTIGSSLQSTYAVYVDGNKPAGTYAGKVKYTLVHPNDANAPNTNAEDISEVTYMQEFAKVSDENRDSIIASMVPEQQYMLTDARDGKTYTIAKYAIPASYSSEESQLAGEYVNSCVAGSCDETIYQQLPSDWQIFVDSCNVATESCDMSLWPNTYDVWMTKNLDLDIDSSKTYTNEDTDLGWNGTSYSAASWTPARSTYAPTSDHTHQWCQGDPSCYNSPESYDPGNLFWNLETDDSWTNWDAYWNSCDYSTSPPSCDQSLNPISTYTSPSGTQQYHLGNYYNWPAAIATNDASIYGVYNDNTGEYENLETNQSICPAGWTLPYTNYNSSDALVDDFVNLWTAYGWDSNNRAFDDITDLTGAPLYFSASGYMYGALYTIGLEGYFWSSVASDEGDARHAYFDVDGRASSSGSGGRNFGFSVRCLLR